MDILGALTIIAVLAGVTALPVLVAWLVIATDDQSHARPLPRLRVPTTSTTESIDRLTMLRDRLRQLSIDEPDRRHALLAHYDRELRRACSRVGVEHRIAELHGVDLELERVRLTEALVSAAEPEQRHVRGEST